ncbi:MAG: substrate-binding domain-containing protein [Rhodoferax sp.]|nr:substrate-binding domain-containing protein [Rhodoferax sp.]
MDKVDRTQPRTIGVVVAHLEGFYTTELMASMNQCANEMGLRLLIVRTGQNGPATIPLSADLVDGWIIVQRSVKAEAVDAMLADGRPVVSIAVSFPSDKVLTIRSDSRSGIGAAVAQLVNRGRRDIAFLGWQGNVDVDARLAVFRDCLARHQLPVRPEYELILPYARLAEATLAVQAALAAGLPLNGVIAASDMLAMGAIQAVRNAGLQVPRDVAVIGYDNVPPCRTFSPPLASIDQDYAGTCRAALTALCEQLDTGVLRGGECLIPSRLVDRVSSGSGVVAVSDHDAQGHRADETLVTEIRMGMEAVKNMITTESISVEARLMALAPYLEWLCTAQWREADGPDAPLRMVDAFNFVEPDRVGQLPPQIPVRQFPPLQAMLEGAAPGKRLCIVVPMVHPQRISVMLAIAPYETPLQIALLPSLMQYVDLLAITLERMALESEALEREARYRHLSEHLELRVQERTRSLEQSNAELARTLDTLKHATEELVRAEKMAALGSLVAGVSHELNTPIGIGVTVVSTLQQHLAQLKRDVGSGGMRRSAMTQYLEGTGMGLDVLTRSLDSARSLVESFKQVAMDQSSDQRRRFDLERTLGDVVLTLGPMYKSTHYGLHVELAPGIAMDSYPGPLGQVITNLLANALLHAFDGRASGHMWLTARPMDGDWVEIIFRDDGVGIAREHRARVFDPFFTTKLGQGGSGLGLNIVYNLVTVVLGGKIHLASELGQGSAMVIQLPRSAPQPVLRNFYGDGDPH